MTSKAVCSQLIEVSRRPGLACGYESLPEYYQELMNCFAALINSW